MGLFLKNNGCEQTTHNGLCACGKLVKIPLQSGDNTYYNGPNLPGTGITECDSFNDAIKKLDLAILEIKQRLLIIEEALNI